MREFGTVGKMIAHVPDAAYQRPPGSNAGSARGYLFAHGILWLMTNTNTLGAHFMFSETNSTPAPPNCEDKVEPLKMPKPAAPQLRIA